MTTEQAPLEQHLFPRQKVLLQRSSHRANSNRNVNGSRRSFAGDATSFRRSDSDRSMGTVGCSMRSIKSNGTTTSSSRPKVKKNFVQKVRTSARYLLKNKTAKFAPGKHLTDVKFIETIDENTDEDLERLWFSANALDDFKGDAEDAASLWEAHPAMAERSAHENPYRGLEDKTPEGQWEAYKARRDVLNAVLDVQDEQMAQSKVPDPQILADTSATVTKAYQAAALERAKKDEEEAKEHCQRERDTFHTFQQKAVSKDSKKTANKESKSKGIGRKTSPDINSSPRRSVTKKILTTLPESPTKIATPNSPRKSMTTKEITQAVKEAASSYFPPPPVDFSPRSPRRLSNNTSTPHFCPLKTTDITFTPDFPKKNHIGKAGFYTQVSAKKPL
eukprot:scaffold307_cov162-Amphora_coffeaeformis.AAC.3